MRSRAIVREMPPHRPALARALAAISVVSIFALSHSNTVCNCWYGGH
jgi:hypothetical protein